MTAFDTSLSEQGPRIMIQPQLSKSQQCIALHEEVGILMFLSFVASLLNHPHKHKSQLEVCSKDKSCRQILLHTCCNSGWLSTKFSMIFVNCSLLNADNLLFKFGSFVFFAEELIFLFYK
jgi:hypothetical protein